MKHWTLARRIAVGMTAIVLTTIALGLLSLRELKIVEHSTAHIALTNVPGLALIAEANELSTRNRLVVYKHIASTDAEDMKDLDTEFGANAQRITQALDAYGQLAVDPERSAALAGILAAREAYRSKSQQLMAASRDGVDPAELYPVARRELDPLAIAYAAAMRQAMARESDEARSSAEAVHNQINGSEKRTAIELALSVLVGIGIGVLIVRSITKVLRAVSVNLNDSASQVAAAASQVAGASQSLANGSSEQAASLEETSASLEEMSSMTRRNAENAEQAKDLAGRTRHSADEGASEMAQMRQAMNEIKASSDEVAKIVSAIDEIAFQTNILALNAAVEAARAGTAGAGFAVVAEEVRALAHRSAQAAKDTAEKIEMAIKKSTQGVAISNRVAQSLSEIVAKAREVDGLVGEINQASNEQSQGIQQVNTAVGEMDKVTQSNASSAEETAAAAEELSAQAQLMRENVLELLRLVDGGDRRAERQPAPGAKRAAVLPTSARPRRETSGRGADPSSGARPLADRSRTPAPARVPRTAAVPETELSFFR